ncbi:MAG: hypothetical protein KAS78_00710 [Candidatus Pacebacteria bacterium]|nr:hypothetical protein [Candidatus Paceibacterota bacterium]
MQEENKIRKYLLKLIISVFLILLIFWLSKTFFDGSVNSQKMLSLYFHPFLKAYFYLIIAIILFEIGRYFIIKSNLKIKSDAIKFLISVVILICILFSNNTLLFFCGTILIIFFLYLRSVFNIKKLCVLLLVIFPITFFVPFLYYSNYHLECFYKVKDMKVSVERTSVSDKLSPIERNTVCSKRAPLNCKFIRSSDIEAFGGWCSDEECSISFMIECTYMCPK